MDNKMFVEGNEAVGLGALAAGCEAFFGYPITPQNEITEFCAREFPAKNKVFVQTQSELGSINMLYGALATGARAMTASSGPGWSLMQETVSSMANAELPAVIVDVQRGGPGGQPIRHAQQDYFQCVKGGGHGDYRNIVLCPASAQECFDHTELAFYLADLYRNPVIVMSDAVIAHLREIVEVKTHDFGPLPSKLPWASTGKAGHKDGKRHFVEHAAGFTPRYATYQAFLIALNNKINLMEKKEVRYECYKTDGAKLILVSYGYTARVSKEAVDRARADGLEVGLIRLITAWPFPTEVIREKAKQGCKFLVVEDSLGQMIEDVRFAVCKYTGEVNLLGILDRHLPTDGGMILPGTVYKRIKSLTGGGN
jgi:2-oxoglutarate ferredoxin oxidoreductase subunit alpha